jgi:glycosyltransferase involved in cell wall biosynthesis
MIHRNWVFYTDAPPLLEGGHGNNGVAVQILRSISERLAFVLTRNFRSSISCEAIHKACTETRLVLHPDASGYGIKKISPLLGSILDFLIFAIWIFFSKDIRSKGKDWFILCGADCWFLLHILLLQKLGISTHIYLVDEIEASSKYQQPKWVQLWIKPTLGLILKNSASVFAISEGFVDYLKSEFQCNAHWLALPSQNAPVAPVILPKSNKSTRNIVFIGGLNHLYLSALKDLYEEISEFNAKSTTELPWKLEILSYCPPDALLSLLSNQDHLIFHHNLPNQKCIELMSRASACFLPYSFSESERIMVTTSFSCKILEYFASGSPILVYGPNYASIPRYFIKENLPVCTTTRVELRQALHDLDSVRTSNYLAKYQTVWEKFHSPEAFKKHFFDTVSGMASCSI